MQIIKYKENFDWILIELPKANVKGARTALKKLSFLLQQKYLFSKIPFALHENSRPVTDFKDVIFDIIIKFIFQIPFIPGFQKLFLKNLAG